MKPNFEVIFKQKIKYANILFTISIFYILGIFVFNSNIQETNDREKYLYDNLYFKKERLNRLNTYEENKIKFVKSFTFAYLKHNNNGKFEDTIKLGFHYLYLYDTDGFSPSFQDYPNIKQFEIPKANKDSINTIIENCESFASELNLLIDYENIDFKTASEISKQKLDSIFKFKKISDILDNEWVESLLKLVKNPNDKEINYRFIDYILTGHHLGYPDGIGGFRPRNFYINNNNSEIRDDTKGHFLSAYLRNLNLIDFKEFLREDLKISYDQLKKFKEQDKRLNTSIVGINIDFNYIFILSGLVIFFFYTLFFVYHRLELESIAKDSTKNEYLFPNFGIIGCPFLKLNPDPIKNRFNHIFTHSVWLIFLITPIIILFIGYLFRYNLIEVLNDDFLISNLTYDKSEDITSFFGDLVNLTALFFSFWMFIQLTKANIESSMKEIPKIRAYYALIIIIIFGILSYFNIIPSYMIYSEYDGVDIIALFSNFIFYLQILAWIIFVYYSIMKSSLLGAFLSIIALIINISLLFMT
ncbi:hypothetical protein [uncultured Dokdonia sp.]|uniref:hypothetical protein n=1 Tax=uncultured Dokdonia sp. TaxID=575653 RepID=UPI00263927A9|nr:hypothetical protein [uncultured Dokdonia sp.]